MIFAKTESGRTDGCPEKIFLAKPIGTDLSNLSTFVQICPHLSLLQSRRSRRTDMDRCGQIGQICPNGPVQKKCPGQTSISIPCFLVFPFTLQRQCLELELLYLSDRHMVIVGSEPSLSTGSSVSPASQLSQSHSAQAAQPASPAIQDGNALVFQVPIRSIPVQPGDVHALIVQVPI